MSVLQVFRMVFGGENGLGRLSDGSVQLFVLFYCLEASGKVIVTVLY